MNENQSFKQSLNKSVKQSFRTLQRITQCFWTSQQLRCTQTTHFCNNSYIFFTFTDLTCFFGIETYLAYYISYSSSISDRLAENMQNHELSFFFVEITGFEHRSISLVPHWERSALTLFTLHKSNSSLLAQSRGHKRPIFASSEH